SVSAPQSATTPPTTQTPINASGCGTWPAIDAGDRKIPDPIVVPMTTAIALQSPRLRGSVRSSLFVTLCEQSDLAAGVPEEHRLVVLEAAGANVGDQRRESFCGVSVIDEDGLIA